jgi:DnaJ-class molecular chaperone
MNKSSEERQNANDKMREVNQAFEVLGDEEKKRRYDLGETVFTTADDYDLNE